MADKRNLTEQEFLSQYNPGDYDLLSASVDVVVFSVNNELQTKNYRKLDEQKLTVLLGKRNEHPSLGKWSLPGGFVGINEPLDETAVRVLHDKTGLDELYIEQLYTFGNPVRDPRMRIISCAYLSLIDRSKYQLKNTSSVSDLTWFEIEFSLDENLLSLKSGHEKITVPVKVTETRNGKIKSKTYTVEDNSSLAFDHATLILEGLLRLRGKIEYTDIVFNLMPAKFTITQLQQIYEVILGQKLLAPAFRRKIAHKIVETGEYTQGKGHKPSQYFKYE